MAVTNLTGIRDPKTYEELFCSPEITQEVQKQLISLIVVNILQSIIAFLGNTLILVALRKESVLHSPSKILFRCLATTDLCVGLISEPLIIVYWMSLVYERFDICRYAQVSIFVTGHLLCSVSLLTLTAIGVDRLIALLLGLRYRQVVTIRRTYPTVCAFWAVSFAGATMYFWKYEASLWYAAIGTITCLVILIFSYTKIFLTLRHHQSSVQNGFFHDKTNSTAPLNIARYKKAVYNALWLQLALVVCYLPYGIVVVVMAKTGLSPSLYIARQVALTLIMLNSSLNPVLYCLKIREVRQAVKITIRQLCCLGQNLPSSLSSLDPCPQAGKRAGANPN